MSEKSMLEEGLRQLDMDFSQEQVDKLLAFMELVLEENQRMNLTAIKNRGEFIQKHLLDSILMWSGHDKGMRVLDLGTGGGFPGVPLKIMHPEWDVVLLDSTMKKIRFLEQAVETLGLDSIQPIHGRAEELGQDVNYRETFDLVFSRAVASLNTLLEYCVPFLKVGGRVIAAKGPKCEEELKLAQNALKALNATVEEVREIQTPGDWGTRFVVVIKKTGKTSKTYPRKQGLPGKKPL